MVVSVWKTPQTQEGTGCLQESFCWLLKDRRETKIRADFCLGPAVREFVLALAGVHNVTALGNLITWQKVDYDFNYHRMEFPCNINVLITSEGRSLLPVWEGLPGSAGELQLLLRAGPARDKWGQETCLVIREGVTLAGAAAFSLVAAAGPETSSWENTEMELPSSFLTRDGEVVKVPGVGKAAEMCHSQSLPLAWWVLR